MRHQTNWRWVAGLIACAALNTMACGQGRVQTVEPSLYKSLPPEARSQNISDQESKMRIVEGKLAKAKTDVFQINQELLGTNKDVEMKHTELVFAKKTLRELKHQNAGEHEINSAKESIVLSRHQWKLAKLQNEYKLQYKRTLEQEITVLEANKNVIASEIELLKIQQVHEYTRWQVPDADLQVANFKEQVRRFEVKESRAKYRLSQLEMNQARDKQRIRQLEATAPAAAVQQAEKPKPFWQNWFSSKPQNG